MTVIRPPAVAGMFYPDSQTDLERTLGELLAHPEAAPLSQAPKALIVPHAGYIYSGPIAASAYAQLAPLKDRIRRVVLLGPSHHVYLRGLALPTADQFRTPLGDIALDDEGARTLDASPHVSRSAAAHKLEHSLEVQLPFLQRVLGDFRLLPLVVGDASPNAVADVLDLVWGGDETLIVISSDLSHYLPDDMARTVDGQTVQEIVGLRAQLDHEQACGATPINGLLVAAQRHGLRAVTLDVRNSSQTAGDADRVVGYAAFAFLADAAPPVTEEEKGATLLRLARGAIGAELGVALPTVPHASWLDEPGATFVTLTERGHLRGCIGTLTPCRPVGEDVQENAVAAAFHDPRFRPLKRAAFDTIRVEVSLLSPTEPIPVEDEAAALQALRPQVDGVVLEYGRHRGLFLPQVWDELATPAEFLAHLKLKAGLPLDSWHAGVRLSRFTVTKWHEPAT